MLGRWKSAAYQWYIRTPPQVLTEVSRQVVAHNAAQEGANPVSQQVT